MTTLPTTDVDPLNVFLPEYDEALPHDRLSGLTVRNLNITLREVVITKEMQNSELYPYERGFIIYDRDFHRLEQNTTYNHAFNMTRRATKLLLDNPLVDSVSYKFANGVKVTYHIEEIA